MSLARCLFGFAACWLGALAFGSILRLIQGPTDADRAVALDTMNSLVSTLLHLIILA